MNFIKSLICIQMISFAATSSGLAADGGLPVPGAPHACRKTSQEISLEARGARLVAIPGRGVDLSVGLHSLAIRFQEKDGLGVMTVNQDGRVETSAYALPSPARPDFSPAGVQDPFPAFYESLPIQERASLEALKEKLQGRAADPGRRSITDCETWTIFTLESFATCPVTYGLGCLAGAYGIFKMIGAC